MPPSKRPGHAGFQDGREHQCGRDFEKMAAIADLERKLTEAERAHLDACRQFPEVRRDCGLKKNEKKGTKTWQWTAETHAAAQQRANEMNEPPNRVHVS